MEMMKKDWCSKWRMEDTLGWTSSWKRARCWTSKQVDWSPILKDLLWNSENVVEEDKEFSNRRMKRARQNSQER